MHKQFMDLNRETAMRLWNKTFGRESKAKDFAGRMMAKGAYNDRNSEFGWNVDHILPRSRGGATADHNLICCHILTNDEKADRFPCFTANGIPFEIRRVQNHYEIHARNQRAASWQEEIDDVDFYDSAAGVRFFKHLKGIQNKKRFIGTVFVYLKAVSNGAVIDFIEELFCTENITFEQYNHHIYLGTGNTPYIDAKISISDYDMPKRSDISELLDRCVLLKTYLSAYFCRCGYIRGFNIYYKVDCVDRMKVLNSPKTQVFNTVGFSSLHNSIFISDFVWENTDAKEKVQSPSSYSEYTEYNYVFADLQKNLNKEANGK